MARDLLLRGVLAALTFATLAPSAASAQSDSSTPSGGGVFDPTSYDALSADQDAQLTLGGFRLYLERTRSVDESLYAVLDPRLDDLEYRETAADVLFGVGGGLGLAALIAGIPVYTEASEDAGVALLVAGAGTLALALIIQAFVRPGYGDLVSLIDLHDERLGRR